MNRTLLLISAILLLLMNCTSKPKETETRAGNIINIPSDYSTIQEGINNSIDGDTIIVAPGIYYENINFNGKNILLTSLFTYTTDPGYISSTIIDGSKTDDMAKGSCVTFESKEGPSAILQGFTIQNGKGSNNFWPSDQRYFIGGGGITVSDSSPTIRYNIICNNGSPKGRMNGGGIGIQAKSAPTIINNIIHNNEGSFGAGISIWGESPAIIKNNIISYNKGGHMYGGAGIGMDMSLAIIENNTIVNNKAVGNGYNLNGTGGAIVVWPQNKTEGPLILRNNIIWGNTQEHGETISLKVKREQIEITYSLVEGGFEGEGNIDANPLFADTDFSLSDKSPCLDSGNPDKAYNDAEDYTNKKSALSPAKGNIRGDMGAFGAMINSVQIPVPKITDIQ